MGVPFETDDLIFTWDFLRGRRGKHGDSSKREGWGFLGGGKDEIYTYKIIKKVISSKKYLLTKQKKKTFVNHLNVVYKPTSARRGMWGRDQLTENKKNIYNSIK